MPKPKNRTLRLAVPVVASLLGIAVAFAFYRSSQNTTTRPLPAVNPLPLAAQSPPTRDAGTPPAGVAADMPVMTPAAGNQTPAAPLATAEGLRALVLDGGVGAFEGVGSLDPASGYLLRVEFSHLGAGVRSIDLTNHYTTLKEDEHVRVQEERTRLELSGPSTVLTPFAALAVEVKPELGAGATVPLIAPGVWRQVAPGAFEATVGDAAGTPVLRVERAFGVSPGSHDVTVRQRVVNLTGSALAVRLFETGPVDLPQGAATYGGDKRRVRFGYLLSSRQDPTRAAVVSNDFLLERAEVLGDREPLTDSAGLPVVGAGGVQLTGYRDRQAWPTDKGLDRGYELVWAGLTNRYFGVAAHPAVDPAAPVRPFGWVDAVSRVVLEGADAASSAMALRLDGKLVSLAPAAGSAGTGASAADLSHSIFAGPLDRSVIRAEPALDAARLAGLVVYNFGGMCGFCTFPFMTGLLLWLLHILHDVVFRDWALAIIFLVVVVRTFLHPVTRWSQIRMAKFGKQMQAVGPKQKVLQEKYKDDRSKLQQETAKLWAEEGISPAGFLGCVPMLLQTPVWIALYATLFFAVELRHEAGFYGVFQSIQPKSFPTWQFLGDLAEPDRLLDFGRSLVNVPLLGEIRSLNVLPLLLGVVFYIQQKYLTPASTMTMTPEQEMQQKMIKWMTVIMFPLFMYNAPSGLALYFTANSTISILESRWIRSHMDKHGMLDLDKMRAERQARRAGKPPGRVAAAGGFLAQLQALAEQKKSESDRGKGKGKGR